MKIAIPLYRNRIAPHFGSSSKTLLVEINGGILKQEAEWDVGGEGAMEMARHMIHLGVEKIICGGIKKLEKQWLMDRGVLVEDNRKGNARDIIERLLAE